MRTDARPNPTAALRDLAATAALLERLDLNPHPRDSASAGQYQEVARRVSTLLAGVEPGPALDMILTAAPATSALYENLRYEHAGLVRSPLEAALAAELAASAAIDKARQG